LQSAKLGEVFLFNLFGCEFFLDLLSALHSLYPYIKNPKKLENGKLL